MDTITKQKAAEKIGIPASELGDHKYFKCSESGLIPSRFWQYAALTEDEYQAIPRVAKEKGNFQEII